MIGTRARTKSDFGRVKRRQEQTNVENLGHAGALTRKIVRNSIRRSKKASSRGSPPRTRRGQLKKSILYHVDKQADSVVIGPSAHLISKVGASHEHGGVEKVKRRSKPPGANWKIEIDGHGPIRSDDGRGSVYIKIRTERQLQRVRRWASSRGKTNRRFANVRRQTKPVARVKKYPKRPFMGPGLEAVKPRLPKLWAGSVN